MKAPVTVLMVGTGGYGSVYLKELLDETKENGVKLVGAVDPYVDKSPCAEQLRERKIPVYDTLEEFYARHTAEMAIVSTPTYLHAAQTKICMENGSDVLCEKPICSCPEDAEIMLEAQQRTGRRLAIGFQWSFNESILALKKDILAGKYGKIKRMRTITYFPRDMVYYRRGGGWAGRRKMPSGAWLLDSVVGNATAHYLHNMLFLCGKDIPDAAKPSSFTAEVYRINPIEMFDTCALRLNVGEGTELMYYATHAVPMNAYRPVEMIIEGEKGEVNLWNENGFHLVGRTCGGEVIEYGDPEHNYFNKIYRMRDAIRENAPLPCVGETALPHMECIWELAQLFPETPVIPQQFWEHDEEKDQNHCDCLIDDLDRCYKDGKLPCEEGFPWAQQSRTWTAKENNG
jgi:predicted dehydrogenase